jgi:hypothetical protein
MTSLVRSLLSFLFTSYSLSKIPCANCVRRDATCEVADGRGSACRNCRHRKERCYALPISPDTSVIDISPSNVPPVVDSTRESLRFITDSFSSSIDTTLGLNDFCIGSEYLFSTINPSVLMSDTPSSLGSCFLYCFIPYSSFFILESPLLSSPFIDSNILHPEVELWATEEMDSSILAGIAVEGSNYVPPDATEVRVILVVMMIVFSEFVVQTMDADLSSFSPEQVQLYEILRDALLLGSVTPIVTDHIPIPSSPSPSSTLVASSSSVPPPSPFLDTSPNVSPVSCLDIDNDDPPPPFNAPMPWEIINKQTAQIMVLESQLAALTSSFQTVHAYFTGMQPAFLMGPAEVGHVYALGGIVEAWTRTGIWFCAGHALDIPVVSMTADLVRPPMPIISRF